MLQNLRDKMQGLVAGAIAVLIALTFALWGIQNYLQGGKKTVAAKVNGEEISQEELRSAYEKAKRSRRSYLKSDFLFDQKTQAKLKKETLDSLIKQKVLYQAQTKLGLGVSRNQLLGVVASFPAFQVDGKFSPQYFQRFVQSLYGSEKAFFADIENYLLEAQLKKGVVDSAFILPDEVAFVKQILKQRRNFGYFIVSPKRFLKDIKVDKDIIKKYYDEHRADFLLPEKVSIEYVELSSNDLLAEFKPTARELKDFYQTRIDSFSKPKKWQVVRVLLPLSKKAKTEEINEVKEKIKVYASKLEKGEDLTKDKEAKLKVTTSWINRRDISSDFFAYVNKLKVGEVSNYFRTKDGYNLVKVLAIKPPDIKSYESVKVKVKKLHQRQWLAKKFSEESDKLADLVYTNPDSLDQAARALNLKIKNTKLFTSDLRNKTGILANSKVVKMAFNDVVLKQRYNSSLIEISPGHAVVLRIKTHIPEKIQPLIEVKSTIVGKIKNQEAKKKADVFANKLLKELQGGSENMLAKKYDLKWHKVSQASYQNKGKNAKLIEAAFNLERPQGKKHFFTRIDLGNDYVVLRLDKVFDVESQSNSWERNMLKSLARKMGRFSYQVLVDSFMKQAKIEIVGK